MLVPHSSKMTEIDTNLKESHPQKYYLRLVSRMMSYFGFGTYWYEGQVTRYPRLYAAWCIFIQSYIFVIVVNEILAIIRTDLDEGEKSEIIQIGFCQLLVVLKYIIVILQKRRIRDGIKKLLEDDREIFTTLKVERQSVKTAKTYLVPIIFVCYSYLSVTLIRWTLASFMNGTPIETQPTYFPTPAHIGFPYSLLRILIIAHWWVHVTMMITTDCLCSLPIFFVAAKFKQVQIYFETMGEKSLKDWSGEDLKKAVVNGIKLHQNALWCTSNIQSAMGNLYGVQIFQTVILIGISLLQLASLERTVSNLISGAAYIVGVSLLTGTYMINSGVVTYEVRFDIMTILSWSSVYMQAARVATSIFHCGWERVPMDKGLRVLLVVAMHRAQKPVYMTAFGMLNLSHESFVLVLRSAYSFFALVY